MHIKIIIAIIILNESNLGLKKMILCMSDNFCSNYYGTLYAKEFCEFKLRWNELGPYASSYWWIEIYGLYIQYMMLKHALKFHFWSGKNSLWSVPCARRMDYYNTIRCGNNILEVKAKFIGHFYDSKESGKIVEIKFAFGENVEADFFGTLCFSL